ncbi:hypothetical protein ROLI_022650 [Roseobacter fucihabitans]|uniref:Uncharacterized protein n=1 Tax=Roseobacter fucihabitans TaxID=1537242 RepID=A0ABZ2BUU3_9RHOB|nr:hypothetical protein [Roseobacter litoralis]MBC6967456.1 hypothetical protein [Roseobacter litoralis]
MEQGVESIIALALFAIIALAAWGYQNARLQNAEDFSVVYTNQLPGMIALSSGPVHCILIRQSGNLYRDLGAFDGWSSALVEVSKSFNRAKIDSVMVRQNNEDTFDVLRTFHSHGGKAEGKKLGGAVIRRL